MEQYLLGLQRKEQGKGVGEQYSLESVYILFSQHVFHKQLLYVSSYFTVLNFGMFFYSLLFHRIN